MAFNCKRKSLKKSYQFLKYARAYLREGRYALAPCKQNENIESSRVDEMLCPASQKFRPVPCDGSLN